MQQVCTWEGALAKNVLPKARAPPPKEAGHLGEQEDSYNKKVTISYNKKDSYG